MTAAIHPNLELLHNHCRERGLWLELLVDVRPIKGRDHRDIVRLSITRASAEVKAGKQRQVDGRPCTLKTLDLAAGELLKAGVS